MSAKSCDSCTMIMVNYADLWLIHSHIASLLDGARLELRELKAHSTLLGACTSCLLLSSDLEADWVLGLRDVRRKVRRVLLSLFLTPATIKKRNHSNQPKLITHQIQSHPSILREK
jgi:hypothetical protein